MLDHSFLIAFYDYRCKSSHLKQLQTCEKEDYDNGVLCENHVLDSIRFYKGKLTLLFCNGETPILNNGAEVDASPNPALSILQLCKLTVTLSTLEVEVWLFEYSRIPFNLPEKRFGHPHNIWLHQHFAQK